MQPAGFIAWIIVGAVAGWLAGVAMKSGGGLMTDVIVGMVGAFIGGFIFSVVGLGGTNGLTIWSILVAFAGAVVLLAVIRLFNRNHPLTN